MKVRDLIAELSKCNQDAEVTSIECKNFEKKYYYPLTVECYYIDDETLKQVKSPSYCCNTVFIF